MKFLFDIIPVILFFVAYQVYDIYVATLVAMAASVAQLLLYRLHSGRFEKMHIITFVIIFVLGSLTLLFKNEWFIKLKPTVVNWAFALAIFVAHVGWKKNAIQSLMQKQISLPAHAWNTLNWSWLFFFLFSGVLNLYIAYYYSTDFWVNFKLFGFLVITLVFIVGQSIFISRFISKK